MAAMTLQQRIGRRVRVARNAKGLSLEDMTRLGVSGSYVSNVETGKHDIRISTLLKLADALNMRASELIEGL